jgi:hypothetical protein
MTIAKALHYGTRTEPIAFVEPDTKYHVMTSSLTTIPGFATIAASM